MYAHFQCNMEQPVTFSITSCKRLDSFCQSMDSFLKNCQDQHLIKDFVCIDDNSTEDDRATMVKRYPFMKFIFKRKDQQGHPKSMNILMQLVDTEFLFHTEDDCLFMRPFKIGDGMQLLNSRDNPGVQMLSYRTTATIHTAIDAVAESPNGEKLCFKLEVFNRWEHPETYQKLWEFEKRICQEYCLGDPKESLDCTSCTDRTGGSWPGFVLNTALWRFHVFKEVGPFRETPSEDGLQFEQEFGIRCLYKGIRVALAWPTVVAHMGVTSAYVLNGTTP